MSLTIEVIGLAFNTAGAITLLVPELDPKRSLDDDLIVYSNPKNRKFTQKKHLKSRKYAVVGLTLLVIGFLLQIFGLLQGS